MPDMAGQTPDVRLGHDTDITQTDTDPPLRGVRCLACPGVLAEAVSVRPLAQSKKKKDGCPVARAGADLGGQRNRARSCPT
jgi:hypothetical protein